MELPGITVGLPDIREHNANDELCYHCQCQQHCFRQMNFIAVNHHTVAILANTTQLAFIITVAMKQPKQQIKKQSSVLSKTFQNGIDIFECFINF